MAHPRGLEVLGGAVLGVRLVVLAVLVRLIGTTE